MKKVPQVFALQAFATDAQIRLDVYSVNYEVPIVWLQEINLSHRKAVIGGASSGTSRSNTGALSRYS
jgi:hypothetical protein